MYRIKDFRKNKQDKKYYAMVSDAGNWDVVTDDDDGDYYDDGRSCIGVYSSRESAQAAIKEYREFYAKMDR